jgi:hypothetical protein
MSDVDDLLAEINAEQREFEQTIWPPASPDAIVRLRRRARDALHKELPEDYVTFLGRNDGLDFNGHVIYGATEHKEPVLSGVVEANDRLGWPQAGALDRPARDVIATFPSRGDAHEGAAGCRRRRMAATVRPSPPT